LITAQKYKVLDLIEICINKIKEKINPTNAMTVLDYSLGKIGGTIEADENESGVKENIPPANILEFEKELETSALDVISRNTKKVIDSEAFLYASNASIKAAIRLYKLIVREADVFQAVSLHLFVSK
jgi:hypothetical protein